MYNLTRASGHNRADHISQHHIFKHRDATSSHRPGPLTGDFLRRGSDAGRGLRPVRRRIFLPVIGGMDSKVIHSRRDAFAESQPKTHLLRSESSADFG